MEDRKIKKEMVLSGGEIWIAIVWDNFGRECGEGKTYIHKIEAFPTEERANAYAVTFGGANVTVKRTNLLP